MKCTPEQEEHMRQLALRIIDWTVSILCILFLVIIVLSIPMIILVALLTIIVVQAAMWLQGGISFCKDKMENQNDS